MSLFYVCCVYILCYVYAVCCALCVACANQSLSLFRFQYHECFVQRVERRRARERTRRGSGEYVCTLLCAVFVCCVLCCVLAVCAGRVLAVCAVYFLLCAVLLELCELIFFFLLQQTGEEVCMLHLFLPIWA